MIDLKTVKEIRIAEGSVKKITNSSGVVLWEVKSTNEQAPCYYVAENVSDLPSTPKYDMAYITSEKSWYALNNKSQWEKYGVIEAVSSLDNLTAYDGKLVYNTTDKHEYKAKLGKQYNETMPSKPSDYVFSNVNDNLFSDFSNIKDGDKFIIYEYDNRNTKITDKILAAKSVGDNLTSWNNAGLGTITDTTVIDQAVWTFEDAGDGTFYIHNNIGAYWSYENHNTAYMPTVDKNSSAKAKVEINTTRTNPTGATTFMPVEHNSGGLYGLNDLFNYGYEFNWYTSKTNGDHNSNYYLRKINNEAYTITTREISWADQGEVKVTQDVPDGYTYPVSYDEYDTPNLNYTECANEAAMKALSCPYEGMKVKLTDTGKKYKFTYNSTTSQYEWNEITSRLDVDLNNQWIASTKTLDGYKVYMSNSNHNVNSGYASMKFKFEGMPNFKLWINSYAESNYDYTVAWNMDVDYPASEPSSSTSGVKAHTSGKQYNPTGITAFTEVDYPNDGGEHFVVVTFRKDGSVNSNDDRGYVAVKLLPISTTWVVSATEFIKKDDKYYQKLNEVGTYTDGSTALTGNYKEGNELPVTYKQGTADDYMFTDGKIYYKNYIYVTPKDQEINTGDYIQGDYIGEATPSMKVTYTDNTEKAFYNLTSIVSNTDPNKKNAKKIEIYDGVTSIGNYAFQYCHSLTGINFSESVTEIYDYSFDGCTGLKDLTFPPSIIGIYSAAFNNCSSLESVTIENSTSKLVYYWSAFGYISSSAKLYVPSNLLADYQADSNWTGAFGGGIFAIPIPAMKVTYTDNTEKTFYNLTSIEYNTDPNKVNAKNVEIYDGVTSIDFSAFQGCSSLTGIIIPSGVTSIGAYAFEGCSSLTGVTIPSGVTSIGDYTFEGCSSLENVTIENSSSKLAYNNNAFANISSSAKLYVPSNLLSDYQADSNWTNAFKGGIFAITPSMKVTYNDGTEKTFYNLTIIEQDTDPNKVNAKSVEIYDSVTSIGEDAFDGCLGLTSVTIGNSVTTIREAAFYDCNSLATVTIENSNNKLTYGKFAFDGISSSAKLFVPSNLLAEYQADTAWTYTFKGGIYAIPS